MVPCAKRLFAVLPLLVFVSAPIYPQTAAKAPAQKTAARPPKYPDSADGLKLLLQDVLASGKLGGSPKLAAFVYDLEIPDYANWFPKAFGKETGDAWAKSYDGATDFLTVELQALFIRLAEQNLEIVTRKVSGAPQSDAEQRALRRFQQPVDVFFAGSRPRPDAGGDSVSASDILISPVGYFWFIDGKFRWDPTNPLEKFTMAAPSSDDNSAPDAESAAAASDAGGPPSGATEAGKSGVSYPSCRYCPAPVYTAAARAARFEGTVVLRVIIQPDGTATDIQVTKSAPYDLDANAIDAVKRWRFNPAVGPNGKPVAVITPIEVTYLLAN
jgi:TonB family protein